MSSFRDILRAGEPEAEVLFGMLTGAGSSGLSITEGGNGIKAITRVSQGVYDFTLPSNVRQCHPVTPGKWATTVTDIDGWDLTWGTYSTTTNKIRLTIKDEANAVQDLPAATGLYVQFTIKKSAVSA